MTGSANRESFCCSLVLFTLVLCLHNTAAAEPSPILALPGPRFPTVNLDCGASDFAIDNRQLCVPSEDEQSALRKAKLHTTQTARHVWDCSLVLAKFLETRSASAKRMKGTRTLELGSGAAGIAGLAVRRFLAWLRISHVSTRAGIAPRRVGSADGLARSHAVSYAHNRCERWLDCWVSVDLPQSFTVAFVALAAQQQQFLLTGRVRYRLNSSIRFARCRLRIRERTQKSRSRGRRWI